MAYRRSASETNVDRPYLITLVFQGCDKDIDGYLNEEDLLCFAGLYDENFNADRDSWSDLYSKMCSFLCCRPHEGLDLAAFMKLVDRDGSGCCCDDELLQWMVQEIQASSSSDEDQSQHSAVKPVPNDIERIAKFTVETSLESLRRINGCRLGESNPPASSSTSARSTGYAFFDSDSDEDAEVLAARMARAARGGYVGDVGVSSAASELYYAQQFGEQDKRENIESPNACRTRPRPKREAVDAWSWLGLKHEAVSEKGKTEDVEAAHEQVSLAALRAAEEEAEVEAAELALQAGLRTAPIGELGRKVQVGGLQPVDESDLVGGVTEDLDPSLLSRQLFFNLAGTETALRPARSETSFERTVKKHAGIDVFEHWPSHNPKCLTKLTAVTEDDESCSGDVEECAGMASLEERYRREQEQFDKVRSRKETSSSLAKSSWRQVAAMPKSTPIGMCVPLRQKSSGTALPPGAASSRDESLKGARTHFLKSSPRGAMSKLNGSVQKELGASFAYKR